MWGNGEALGQTLLRVRSERGFRLGAGMGLKGLSWTTQLTRYFFHGEASPAAKDVPHLRLLLQEILYSEGLVRQKKKKKKTLTGCF